MNKPLIYFSYLVILIAVIILIVWIAVQLLPREFWFTYDSVVSANTTGEIQMVSKIERNRSTALKFNDVLKCKVNDRFSFFSNYLSEGSEVPPHELKEFPWVYGGRTPEKTTECFIESEITASVSFGTQKKQFLTSNTFLFTP